MATAQRLLFPDPQPLVERLGRDFFRGLPESPGVYLMRDATHLILYVGKAKNLRKRLANYLTANPERLSRRRLRLLHAVATIEVHACVDEAAALRHEASLIRTLKPRFNRAGTWPAPARYLVWRIMPGSVELRLAVKRFNDGGKEGSLFPSGSQKEKSTRGLLLELPKDDQDAAVLDADHQGDRSNWNSSGPYYGWRAGVLRPVLVRLLWCALHPTEGISGIPFGWLPGRLRGGTVIRPPIGEEHLTEEAGKQLHTLFAGKPDSFCDWMRERIGADRTLFEAGVIEADLQFLRDHFGG